MLNSSPESNCSPQEGNLFNQFEKLATKPVTTLTGPLYRFCHNNPVNNVDPSGRADTTGVLAKNGLYSANNQTLREVYQDLIDNHGYRFTYDDFRQRVLAKQPNFVPEKAYTGLIEWTMPSQAQPGSSPATQTAGESNITPQNPPASAPSTSPALQPGGPSATQPILESIPATSPASRPAGPSANLEERMFEYTSGWEGLGKPGKPRLAYPDSNGNNTIGIGHLLQGNTAAQQRRFEQITGVNYDDAAGGKATLTKEQMLALYKDDLKTAESAARKSLSNFDALPQDAQVVILDIMHNMGTGVFDKYTDLKNDFLGKKPDFKQAAWDLTHKSRDPKSGPSLYTTQVQESRWKTNEKLLSDLADQP